MPTARMAAVRAAVMTFRFIASPLVMDGGPPDLPAMEMPAPLRGGALGALALVFLEEALAQADRLRRDLGELVVADELHRVLERERDRRREVDRLVLARGADVGELLGLDRVHHEVVVARVDADDHALVDGIARADEHAPALLQLPERISHRDAVVLRHQHAVAVLFELALRRPVVVEDVAHDAGAARHGHELALEADQPARRDAVVEPHAALAVRHHVEELAAPAAELFHYHALVDLLDVDREHLVGLAAHAVEVFKNDSRPRHRQLVALAPHVLEQDGQMQLAASVHDEGVGIDRIFDPHGDVALGLAFEALADLPAGDVLAFLAG